MSACWRTTSVTASLTRAPSFFSSTGSPRALARIICRMSGGRGRLPACVVRILSVERFMLLLSLDVCCLDDRPPLLDLGLLKGGKRIRRLLVARRTIEPLVGDALLRCRVGQRLDHGRIQPGDDVLRRALRHPEAPP